MKGKTERIDKQETPKRYDGSVDIMLIAAVMVTAWLLTFFA